MDVTVSSRQMPVSAALRAAAEEKISRLERYLDGMERAEVHFAEERNPRIADRQTCEVTLHGHGHLVRAKVAAPDVFAAVDAAVDKLEHQLHKLKSKLVARHHGRRGAGSGPSSAEANGSPPETDVATADGDELGPESFPLVVRIADEAKVVKTKRFSMKPMTPDEAILQMELLGHQFFLFTNAHTGLSSVVYQRDDGDIGLIEPSD
jgi:putative sigma-54 modulation protein